MIQSSAENGDQKVKPTRRRSRSSETLNSSPDTRVVQTLEEKSCNKIDKKESLQGAKRPKKVGKIKKTCPESRKEGTNNLSLDASTGDISSEGIPSSKNRKKIKRKKDGNCSDGLDQPSESVSSLERRETSKSESIESDRTTKKKKRSASVKKRGSSSSEGRDRKSTKTTKKLTRSTSPTRRRASTTSPAPKTNNTESQVTGSPKMEQRKILNRAVSTPTLKSPVESLKKKIGTIRSSFQEKMPANSTSQSTRSSPGENSKRSGNSVGEKLSPSKQVGVSPSDVSAKKPQRGASPIPGPPFSLKNSDSDDHTSGEKNDSLEPVKNVQSPLRKRSVSPRQRQLISRIASSSGLAAPTRTGKKVPRNITSMPLKKQSPAPLPQTRERGLNRTFSSPALSSPLKKAESPSHSRYGDRYTQGPLNAVTARVTAMIAEKNEDGRPKKHKPISRRGILQHSSSRQLQTKRSSSHDDAINQKPLGPTFIETEPIRKIPLFPQNGRHMERNVSVGNLQERSPGSLGRPVPERRGMKRYSSAPLTSSHHDPTTLEGNHRMLRSISEDENEHSSQTTHPKSSHPSSSADSECSEDESTKIIKDEQIVPLKVPLPTDKRAGNHRTQSVPILGGRRYDQSQRGRTIKTESTTNDFSAAISRKVSRTKSDDLSSLSKSLHGKLAETKRRSSFDDTSTPQLQSILRNSSHHTCLSHSTKASPQCKRSKDRSQKNFVTDVGFASSADVYYASSDDEDAFSVDEETIQFEPKAKATPLPSRPGLKRSSSSGSGLNLSIHSLMTTRSMLSVDKDGFEDDPQWKQVLRYLRLLPSHKDEDPLKKRIRIFTWTVLFLDFISAMVALAQYDGATTCCGQPIFSILINLNWDVLFRVVTYLYLIVIFAEVLPVVRQLFVFNILKPAMGFAITFAMFFDDSVGEAVAMWILEATAIFFEFLIYRVKAIIYHQEMAKLEKTDSDLAEFYKNRRASQRWSRRGMGSLHGSQHSMPFSTIEEGDDDSDSSMSGGSFGSFDSSEDSKPLDEELNIQSNVPVGEANEQGRGDKKSRKVFSRDDFTPKNSPSTAKTVDLMGLSGHGSIASTVSRIPKPGERREMQLLRERRILRQKTQSLARELRVHFIATCINFGLIVISLILIITISSTGGLCMYDEKVKIFSMNQLGKCNRCDGTSTCEVCDTDGPHQCYYPYY
ncbi:hypothetical protein IV203_025457 [Nitzschia inconspicua]|uniref:Uncharacterized protein n=1 Tax=Nitzschia inconspicua TaxID=303405 RepID=A0A9K3LIB4_9STRA|nr:hypothetical protein IV203_028239 [Nitzschia inconspicua]KAG7362573.1 hypothetical protein IV203_025457 [Nitzschia inconspicua]